MRSYSRKNNGHPLDDGRTLLATGMIKKAKQRAQELIDGLKPFVRAECQ